MVEKFPVEYILRFDQYKTTFSRENSQFKNVGFSKDGQYNKYRTSFTQKQ